MDTHYYYYCLKEYGSKTRACLPITSLTVYILDCIDRMDAFLVQDCLDDWEKMVLHQISSQLQEPWTTKEENPSLLLVLVHDACMHACMQMNNYDQIEVERDGGEEGEKKRKNLIGILSAYITWG
jgi:hypothetical protein